MSLIDYTIMRHWQKDTARSVPNSEILFLFQPLAGGSLVVSICFRTTKTSGLNFFFCLLHCCSKSVAASGCRATTDTEDGFPSTHTELDSCKVEVKWTKMESATSYKNAFQEDILPGRLE